MVSQCSCEVCSRRMRNSGLSLLSFCSTCWQHILNRKVQMTFKHKSFKQNSAGRHCLHVLYKYISLLSDFCKLISSFQRLETLMKTFLFWLWYLPVSPACRYGCFHGYGSTACICSPCTSLTFPWACAWCPLLVRNNFCISVFRPDKFI